MNKVKERVLEAINNIENDELFPLSIADKKTLDDIRYFIILPSKIAKYETLKIDLEGLKEALNYFGKYADKDCEGGKSHSLEYNTIKDLLTQLSRRN